MTRTISSKNVQTKPVEERKPGFGLEEINLPEIEVQDLTPGLVTDQPRDKRPAGSFIVAQNARIRRDFVRRRGGYGTYISPSPDANPVIKVIPFRDEQDVDWLIRIAQGSGHATRTTTGAWLTLAGPQYDDFVRFTWAQFPPQLLFIASGDRRITQVDVTGAVGEFVPIPDSTDEIELESWVLPQTTRYLTNYADRLVAAYNGFEEGGVLTSNISWSAPADPFQWAVNVQPLDENGDPAFDEDGNPILIPSGAGQENLVSSPSDTGDEITGIISFDQVMVIFRERTIWHATRQPFAIAPFRFFPAVTDVGCDMPYTIRRISGGIVWADFRTQGVYFYRPGIQPQKLNDNIEDLEDGSSFLKDIEALEAAESAFDAGEKEFHLGYSIGDISPFVLGKYWVFNFETRSWARDTGPPSNYISDIDDVGSQLMIDDVTSFIDVTPGTIDSYKPIEALGALILKSGQPGTVKEAVIFNYDDEASFDPNLVGNAPEMELVSQEFVPTARRRSIQTLWMRSQSISDDIGGGAPPGAISTTLSVEVDDVETLVKSYNDTATRKKIGFKRSFTGDNLKWVLKTRATDFRLFEWWAKVVDKSIKYIVGS